MNFFTKIAGGGASNGGSIKTQPQPEVVDHNAGQVNDDNTSQASSQTAETVVQIQAPPIVNPNRRTLYDPKHQDQLLTKLKLIESEILKESCQMAMMQRMLTIWSNVSVRHKKAIENTPLELLPQKAMTIVALIDLNDNYYSAEESHSHHQLPVNDTGGVQSLLYTSRYLLAGPIIGTQPAAIQQFLAAVANDLRLNVLRPILYKPLLMSSYLTFPLMASPRESQQMWWIPSKRRSLLYQIHNYASMIIPPQQQQQELKIEFRLDPLVPFEQVRQHVTGMTIMSCSMHFLYLSQWEQLGPIKISLTYDDQHDNDDEEGWSDFDIPSSQPTNITASFVNNKSSSKKEFEWQYVVCTPCGQPIVLADLVRQQKQRQVAAQKRRALKRAAPDDGEDDEDEEEEEEDEDDEEEIIATTTQNLPMMFYDPVSNNKQQRWLLTEPRVMFDPDVPGHVYVERTELWVLFVVPHATIFGQYGSGGGETTEIVVIKQNLTVLVALTAIYAALLKLQGPPHFAAESTAKLRAAMHQMLSYHDGQYYCTDADTWAQIVQIVQSNSRILRLGDRPAFINNRTIIRRRPALKLTLRPYLGSHHQPFADNWRRLLADRQQLDNLYGSISLTLNARYFVTDLSMYD